MPDWSDGLIPADEPPGSTPPPTVPGGGLTPPPPTVSTPWGDLMPAAETANAAPETFGPPNALGPAAPYGFQDAVTHAMTFGLTDPASAAGIAARRWATGETPDFDYSRAAAEVQRGREAYAQEHPWANLGATVAGSLAGPGGEAANMIKAAPWWAKVPLSAATSAGIGGVQGAAENTASVDQMLQGGKTGAEVGGVAGAAIPAVGGLGSWFLPRLSQEAQILRAAGIQPTPGSLGRFPYLAEEGLSHIPLLGSAVQGGRAAAQQQLQDTIANYPSLAAPLTAAGKILPGAAHGQGVGSGVLGAELTKELLTEGPSHLLGMAKEHPWITASLPVAYGLLKGAYSNPGRWATTGLLGAAGQVPPAIGASGPVAAQVLPDVPGLLSYYNRQAQP